MPTSESQASQSLNDNPGGTSLVTLAENILEQAKTVASYFDANNLPQPTFSPGSSHPPATDEYLQLQTSLRASIEDLQWLVEGPHRSLRSIAAFGYDIAALQVALDFNFFTLVPADGDISLVELAENAGLDLDRTSGIVRMLVTRRFFEEKQPGYVSHSASSLVLREDEELRCTVHYSYDEMLKASAETSYSLKADPSNSDGTHCPFYTRHGLPIFQFYEKYPDKAARFAKAMAGATRSRQPRIRRLAPEPCFTSELTVMLTPGSEVDRHIKELRDCFPWAQLNGTVVDVGGGSGHISMTLAQLFPDLNFVVQDDSDNMLGEGRRLLTDDLSARISFVKQSFFEPQPRRDDDPAAAYLLRQCTHNWCDRDVVTMFRSLVPGLESSGPGTPLLVNDIVMHKPGQNWPRLLERDIRQIDMIMLICFGGKQRTREEFEALLKEADARYEIENVHASGPLGLLEVYLR